MTGIQNPANTNLFWNSDSRLHIHNIQISEIVKYFFIIKFALHTGVRDYTAHSGNLACRLHMYN